MRPIKNLLYTLLVPPFLIFLAPPALAQSADDKEFRGQEYHDGTNSLGSDTVDLLELGLTVTQELTPPFKVNDLAYQVTAYYQGTGTSAGHATDGKRYTYFSPATIWGPMGAGWTVHMGKLLSSGRIDFMGLQSLGPIPIFLDTLSLTFRLPVLPG